MRPADLLALGQELAAPLPERASPGAMPQRSTIAGGHARRRKGPGDGFWQYRPAEEGEAGAIDWRRSARSDQSFVQEKEWQTAKPHEIWVDAAASMAFGPDGQTKQQRAQLLAMGLAAALVKEGDSAGVLGSLEPATGRGQLPAIAANFLRSAPELSGALIARQSTHIVIFSDFLAPLGPLEGFLNAARAARVRGILVQVLDPAEITFPFTGPAIFADMAGGILLECKDTAVIAAQYAQRLNDLQDTLRQQAANAGWQMTRSDTSQPAGEQLARLWLMMNEGA